MTKSEIAPALAKTGAHIATAVAPQATSAVSGVVTTTASAFVTAAPVILPVAVIGLLIWAILDD